MNCVIKILHAWLCLTSISNVYCDNQEILKKPLPIDRCKFEQKVLLSRVGRPYNLHVHRVSNTLFFSFVKSQEYDFQIGSFNLELKEYNSIPGLEGGCSIAIDQFNDIIYLGGSNGIFTYNRLTKIADAYSEMDKNIWALFFKHSLFYIRYPKQTLYIQVGTKFSTVKEFENFEVDTFFMSSKGLILFANKTGFYKFHSELMKTTLLNKSWHIRQIAEDNMNNVYVATNSGVYVHAPDSEFTRVLNFKDVLGLTFDKYNNLIFSNESNIMMLKFNDKCRLKAMED